MASCLIQTTTTYKRKGNDRSTHSTGVASPSLLQQCMDEQNMYGDIAETFQVLWLEREAVECGSKYKVDPLPARSHD